MILASVPTSELIGAAIAVIIDRNLPNKLMSGVIAANTDSRILPIVFSPFPNALLSGPLNAKNASATRRTISVACSITVNAQLSITTGNAPNGFLNVPYSHQWAAVGGLAPLAFQIQSGALPNGLSLNTTTGVISGTPKVLGQFNFTIRVTDSIGTTSDIPFELTVLATAYAGNLGGQGGIGCGCGD